jgi:hypothetical protein
MAKLQLEGRITMTKTTKALITSAAVAGLIAGTGVAVQASTVLTNAKASFSATTQDKKDDSKKVEKHACKGQNSCKGKGGCGSTKGKNDCKGKGECRTDGKPMAPEAEKKG